MKIAIAQINPVIGDFEGNASKMEAFAKRCGEADMVVFPELCVCGYYPDDLLLSQRFLEGCGQAVKAILEANARCGGMWVFGAPMRREGPGKPLANSLLAAEGGVLAARYDKRLLPTYNIFDERRHFEPGSGSVAIDWRGARIAFAVCEDLWNDLEGKEYAQNPAKDAEEAGADILVTINASPASSGKQAARQKRFCELAKRRKMGLVYANQVGANDTVAFDGSSFICSPDGSVAARALAFEEDAVWAQWDGKAFAQGSKTEPLVEDRYEFFERAAVMGLRDYMSKAAGFAKGVVVGSSGGIDSALTLALATLALGPQKVLAVTMPTRYSSAGSVGDSRKLCDLLGVELAQHPIEELRRSFEASYEAAFGGKPSGIAAENLQARIRGVALMEVSNMQNRLLLSTGNKSETSVGYCTLYGDTNGGLNLIGDLYKTEIFELCRRLNAKYGPMIPQEVIDKPPSAELAPDQKDTDSLPEYATLDALLRFELETPEQVLEDLGPEGYREAAQAAAAAGAETAARVRRLIKGAEFKRRQAPPIIRMHGLAFGIGRRIPLAAAY